MSALRRSGRLAASAHGTPSSTITLTPKSNSITRFGGVKRRLQNDDTPVRSKAAKLLAEESTVQQQQSPLETPKKKKQLCYSPVKFDDEPFNSPVMNLGRSTTPPRSLFPATPPKSIGFSTPVRSPARVINFDTSSTIFDTPKSARRRLFPGEDEITRKRDLLPSTFATPKTPGSAMGTMKRIAEQGKFNHLSSPIKNAMNYPLPKKYQPLYDSFEQMERVVAFDFGKKQSKFDDIVRDVQKKTKKNFTKEMLAQILSVYPTSYIIKLDPGKKSTLFVVPNLKHDIESYWRPPTLATPEKLYGSPTKLLSPCKSPKKTPTKATPQLRELRLDTGDRLEAWRQQCRKAIFRYKLLVPIFEAHEGFLKKIGDPEFDNGTFHPKFNLESAAPALSTAELPTPGRDRSIQTKIAPYLIKEETFVLPLNVEETLAHLKSPQKPTHTPNGRIPLSPTKFASMGRGDTPKLSITERIMLKQKAREEKENPEMLERQQKRNQLENLSKELLYSLWSYFAVIKPRTTEEVDKVLHQIGRGSNLTGGELIAHIELLCECAPAYFEIFKCGEHSRRYLRLTAEDANCYQMVKALVEKEMEKYL